ncbi:hypothetical protein DFH29DRAFT_595710 [Suillus ampliporus]|nr:hypothetical protein DFH29DRAFT_595710 [Suillus ampliporus]
MAQIRCMHFDESGNPRGGGCRAGHQCNFIHPGNPAWDNAQVPRNAPRGHGLSRGGSFGESRGSFTRGRGRGSGGFNSSNSSIALGWDTGGGSSANTQSSGWETGNAKDSVKPASESTASMWGSGWDTDDPWGIGSVSKEPSAGGSNSNETWGSNSVTKESSASGRGSEDTRGSSSRTKESSVSGWGDSSGGGWGNSSGGDKSSGGWGASETTSHAQENRSSSAKKDFSAGGQGSNDPRNSSAGTKEESSAGGWGSNDTWGSSSGTKESSAGGWGASGSGWGNSSGGDKSSGGWGTSGTKEITSHAQEKRNDADQENRKSKPPIPPPPRPLLRTSSGLRAQADEEDIRTDMRPLTMTGTNQVPMTNTKWNKKLDTTASPHAESFEKPRVPPLQTSALNNSTTGEPSALSSANRTEEDRMDVENWRMAMPEKARGGSPSVSTVTAASAVNRKRKHGSSDLERKQEVWRDFIRVLDRAVRAKVDLAKAEVDRQKWRRTQKSAGFSRIGEAGRIRLDGLRAELEKVCNGHSDKLTQAIGELAEVGDKLRSGIDYDRRYDIGDEVTSYLREVGAWLSDIRPLLIASTSQHPPNTNNPTPHEDNESPEEPCATPDGLDPLRSRLDKQEEVLEELRTALTLEPQNQAIATINERIDKKVDALREARAAVKAQRAKQAPPKVDIPPEAMGTIEDVSRKATELSAAMATPVNDIAHLLIRQNEIQKTQASVKIENEELKESIAKLTETSVANRKLIQEQTEAIQRLKASLEAASELRRTPPPAEPPIKVMFEELRTAVDGVVQDIVSREVVPTMKQLSEACRLENQAIHREVFETIWDRIEPCLKIAEAVNRWVTRLDLPAS